MSQVIDRKIVDMEFNNSRFESNVSQTMSTLDKLKEKLSFNGIGKTLESLDTASKNIKMDGLKGAIETVSAKFSALEVIGVTALANITNSAVNLGKNFIKSISLDQISAGWQKYADKTAAVQTIMAATREEFAGVDNQMELVEEQLERLNWFTDETSYKFVDMVGNIGKFTSAGVKLETATTAMQGIATWAAISGQNAEKASHAMYNLSQALGSGVVRLQDWRSIETVNMSTIEFKNIAIEAALALGTLKKNSKGVIKTLSGKTMSATKDFNESLKTGWFTADVLMKTLDTYGGFANKLKEVVDETGLSTTELLGYLDDYSKGTLDVSKIADEAGMSVKDFTKILDVLNSDTYDLGRRAFVAAQEAKTFQEAIDYVKEAVSTGWMKTFELIFGNYEKAKKLWSDVAENFYTLFVESGDNRNELLSAALYKDEWDEFSESIEGSTIKMKDLSKEDRELAKSLELTAAEFNGLKKMAKETGTPVEELANNFKRISGSDLIVQSIGNAFEALLKVIDVIKEAWNDIFPATTAEQLYGLIERFEKFTKNLILSDEQAENLSRTLKGLFAVLDIGWYIVQTISGVIKKLASAIFDVDLALEGTSKLGDLLVKIRNSIRENDRLGKILNKIADILVKIIKYIKETIRGNTNLGKLLRTIYGSIKNVLDKFKEFRNKTTEKGKIPSGSFLDLISKAFAGIKNGIEKVSEAIDKAWPDISKIFSVIFDYTKKLGSGAWSFIKDFINDIKESETIQNVVQWLSEAISKSINFIKQTVSGENDFGKTIRDVVNNIKEALSVAIERIKEFFGLIFKKQDSPKDSAISVLESLMLGVKTVIEFLSKVLTNIWPMVKTALTTVSGFFKDVTNFLTDDGYKNAIGLLKVGILTAVFVKIRKSLKNISSLVENLSTMFKNIGGTFKGLKSYLKTLENSVKYESIKNIAISLALLAAALYVLSKISWKEFAVGAAGIGLILAALTGLVLLLNSKKIDEEKVGKAALALIGISASMLMMAGAMKMLSNLSWENLLKGMAALGYFIGIFFLLGKGFDANGDSLVKMAGAMVIVSLALLKMALALKAFGNLRMDEILKGLVGLSGTLLAISLSLRLIQDTKGAAASLSLAAIATLLLVNALKVIGSMNTGELIKSLIGMTVAVGLLVTAVLLINQTNSESAAVSLLIISAAMVVLAVALKKFGSMDWGSILRGLVAIAGVIAVIGVAAVAFGAATPAMMLLGAALAFVGIGLIAVGKGLQVLAKGIKLLGNVSVVIAQIVESFINAVEKILEGLILLIPRIAESLVLFIIQTIKELLPALGTLIPMIVEFVLKLIFEVLSSLVEYIPKIVDLLFDLLIGVIKKLTERYPEFIDALVEFFMAVMKGFADALKKIDPEVLAEGFATIGILAAIMAAMAGLAVLAPLAIAGVVAFGLVIAELALVLAGLSKLFSNEGMIESIRKAKDILGAIGEAFGALIGGFALGMSEKLPEIATYLSDFMVNLEPFLDGASKIPDGLAGKVLDILGVIVAITAVEVIDSLTAWITGGIGDSISKFGEQIVPFGRYLAEFAEEVRGIDNASIEASANAALILTKFAKNIPNEGGWIASIFGDNTLPVFAQGLVEIGYSLQDYYECIKGIDSKTVEASANAALTLANFAKNIPNEGGWIAAVVGDNTLTSFAKGLIPIGLAIRLYYENIKGIDANAVTTSANAAMTLAEFADKIPNEGGWVAKVFGDNTISQFADDLPALGRQLKLYADNIEGIDGKTVTASANAALSLAELANNLPNEGGFLAAIFGDNNLETFAATLEPFGQAIKKYSDSVRGVDTDAITSATSSASAIVQIAKVIKDSGLADAANGISGQTGLEKFSTSLVSLGNGLAEYSNSITSNGELDLKAMNNASKALMLITLATSFIPKTGDIFGAGGVNIENFGNSLKYLGTGIAEYSAAVSGDNELDLDAVNKSIKVAAKLIVLSRLLKPSEDFISVLFGGENDFKKFGEQIPYLGKGIAEYYANIKDQDIDSDKVDTSVTAASKLAKIYDSLEKVGGVVSWFTGQKDLSKFGDAISGFGVGLSGYWESIGSSEFDISKIDASVDIAIKLASLYDHLDELGGVAGFFSGEKDLSKFAQTLPDFARGILNYSSIIEESTVPINADRVNASIEAATKLVTLGDIAKDFKDENKLKKFADSLPKFADSLSKYAEKAYMSEDQRKSVANSVNDASMLITLMSYTSQLDKDCTKNFVDGLKNLGSTSSKDFVKAFENSYESVKSAAEGMVNKAILAIKSSYQGFKDAGKYAVSGFIAGLKDPSKRREVTYAGAALGKAALDGTKNSLNSHSPSKEYENIGEFCPIGLYRGVLSNLKYSELAGEEIGDSALSKTKSILSKISEGIDDNINVNPVIRPVLDLDDIESGSNRITAMLSTNKAIDISARSLAIDDETNDTSSPDQVNNWSFVQNNYSPKALSAGEIYRQTKNQFSTLQRKTAAYGKSI